MRLDRANHFDRSTEISLRVMTRGRAGLHAVACDDTDPTSQTGTPRPFRSSAGTPGARAAPKARCGDSLRSISNPQTSPPGLTGRPSIPEHLAIEPRRRGVLDAPLHNLTPASGRQDRDTPL